MKARSKGNNRDVPFTKRINLNPLYTPNHTSPPNPQSLLFLLLLLPLPIPHPPIQHALPPSPPPSPPPQNLPSPPRQLITPPATHQDPTDDIHDPNEQPQKPHALFPYGQQDGFDVEFEEDAGDGAFADGVGVGGRGVLVRDDGVAGAVVWREGRVGALAVCGGFGGSSGGAGVDCGDDGEVVLVFVEVGGRGCVGAVEGVEEGRVEGPEGEFVDDVGEVEGFELLLFVSQLFFGCFGWRERRRWWYRRDLNAHPSLCIRVPGL